MTTSPRGSQRRRQPVRTPGRRPLTQTRNVEPPDYARDYAYVRRDLIMIAIIGGLLFAGLIAVSFVL